MLQYFVKELNSMILLFSEGEITLGHTTIFLQVPDHMGTTPGF